MKGRYGNGAGRRNLMICVLILGLAACGPKPGASGEDASDSGAFVNASVQESKSAMVETSESVASVETMPSHEPDSVTSPWEYPIQPGSEEWSSLEITEAVAKLDVPREVVDAMTTQALCKTVLSYPLIDNIFAYDDAHFGITATKGSFYALDAFLQREEAVSCLDDALSEAEAKLAGADEDERLKLEDRKLVIKVLKDYVTGEDYDHSSEGEKKISISY